MNFVQTIRRLFGKSVDPSQSPGTVVIGTQIADATAAQQRHEQLHGSRQSPLADISYSNVESRLWRWTDSPLDSQIEAVTAEFAALNKADRASMRDSLTMDDFYTLLNFARRSTLAALRGGIAEKIEPAPIGLAMIDLERIDWRDLHMASSLISYAGERLNMALSDIAERTMMLAKPQTAEIVLQRLGSKIDLARSCGYREIDTREGVALFETGYEPFSPESNLTEIAFDCALTLEKNGYEIHNLKVASDLPLIWLGSNEGTPIAKMVRNISGSVSIRGIPLSDPAPSLSGQSLLVFLAEAASENDAREIAAAAQQHSNRFHTQLGVASRRACAVVIQRSCMADTAPLEDARSLERLRAVFEDILE